MPELLRDHTTIRVGGPAETFVVATSEEMLINTVRQSDRGHRPVLIIGAGSNLVVADSGFAGVVIKVATRGIRFDTHSDHTVVTAAAGEPWDDFVGQCCAQGFAGIEALSGIPGVVGSTPIQNVGAYGQEVSQAITQVRVWDRRTEQQIVFSHDECEFGYRSSIFKSNPGRWLVLEVAFKLRMQPLSMPVRYAELAAKLGIELGQATDVAAVRRAVIEIRRAKAMVVDSADHDTWSAGSFFTNPIITAEQAAILPEAAPRYPAADGMIKTSAAWLIEHAGFPKGYGPGAATLSTKHVLAITNRGDASASEVLALAEEIITGVKACFGITLHPEPVIAGL